MASITVNKNGKVTNVTNGTKSNTNLSESYTVGQKTNYNTTKKAATSNAASNIIQSPKPAGETLYSGSNVSADTPVLGSFDAPAYGMTTNNTPVIGSMDSKANKSVYASIYDNPTDEEIRSLAKSSPYSNSNPGGYAPVEGSGLEGSTYTARQTAYTFVEPDGTAIPVYSNLTNYNDARNAAIAEGAISPNATFKNASTYGVASLGTKKGYNYGGTTGGDGYSGFGADAYVSDKQYGKMYDQNNMQLEYLSGRDGMDYSNPYAYAAYNGNGLSNAYNKGLENAGTGATAGAYGVGQAGVRNNTLANSGSSQYQGMTADDIASQYGDMANNYQNAIDDVNDSIAANYGYQTNQTNSDAQKSAQALYIQKAIAERDMPQQLSSQGISGGLTESSLLGLNANYQTAWQANEESRVNAVNQLQIAQQTALAQNNMTAAQFLSELQQNSLQLQQQISSDMNNFNLSVAAAAQSAYESDRAYNYQVAQDSISNAYAAATLQQQETEAKYNAALQMGDYDTAAKLEGVSATHAKQMQAIELAAAQLELDSSKYTYTQKKTNSLSSGSSGRSSSSSSRSSSTASNTASGEVTDKDISSYLNKHTNGYGTVYVYGSNSALTPNEVYAEINEGTIVPVEDDSGNLMLVTKGYYNAIA